MASATAPRSGRMSVTSLASIATSVPVPIAMPTSACANARLAPHGHQAVADGRPDTTSGLRRELARGAERHASRGVARIAHDRLRDRMLRQLLDAGREHDKSVLIDSVGCDDVGHGGHAL